MTLMNHMLRLSAAAMLAIPVPTAAQLNDQPRIGSRIPTAPKVFHKDITRKVVRDFAECVVAKNRTLASQYVLDRSSLGLDSRYAGLRDGGCLVHSTAPIYDEIGLRLDGGTLRFALADALLREEISSIEVSALPKAQALPLPRLNAANYEPEVGKTYAAHQMEALEARRQSDQAALVMYRFGECVVRSNPQGARAILQAIPESAEENRAVQSAMPALSQCVQKDVEFKLDTARLRGALAFAYYSLAHAPAAEQ